MSRKLSYDALEALMEHGIDRRNRRLFLNDIDEGQVTNIIKGIYFFESESRTEPIELFVSSVGGSLYEMFGLYDVLNTVRCPIVTCAVGKCWSAAPLLVAAGRKGERYACPHTTFMFHQSSQEGPSDGRLGYLEAEIRHHRDLEERWYTLLAKHSKRDTAFWRREAKRTGNVYYTADDAVDFGVVDALWVERDE